MNTVNVTLCVIEVLFITFLMAIYFTKKNMPNIENKIYRVILVLSFLTSLSDLIFWVSCFYLKDYPFVVEIMQKFYLFFLIGWLVFLTYYVVVVTNSGTKLITNLLGKNNKISIIPSILILILTIIEFILPLGFEIGEDNVLLYAIGDIYLFIVGVVVSLSLIAIIAAIFGRKNIVIKKAAPILVFSLYEGVIFLIYCFNRTICAFSLSSTLTSYLMYHTIENPDIKLINELTLAKNQAEKSNRAKTDFLSSMSHELRTPLNAIVGLSELIDESDDLDEIHEDTKDIVMASQNLLELVNGILDINKLEANRMELVEVNYNPIEVFEDLTRMIKVRIGNKPIELRTDFSSDLPNTLHGDKEKIKQIISNLLTNAVKYTDEGHIDFTVSCINKDNKSTLTITVTDTGRGIKDENKEMLFTKFYRLDEDKDSDIEGTGLGLSITKSLVELFDGKISVESIYGVGSTFKVVLSQNIVNN